MLDSIRNNSRSWGVKLIFGAIILVFVFWGVGSFRGSGSGGVATVNGETITIEEYHEYFIPIFEAERGNTPDLERDPALFMEFKREVLRQLVVNRLWQQEAKRLGLFVSPYDLRESIAHIGIFQDESGKFSKDRYLKVLRDAGRNVAQYENAQAAFLLAEKLQRYIASGVGVTEAEARNYYDFIQERRKAQYVLFEASDYLKDVQVSEEAIAAYYEAHKESFRTPAMIDLGYLVVKPETLAAGITISDREAEEYYKTHEAEFSTPERYHVRHIFVAISGNAAGASGEEPARQAHERMDAIVKALAGGESFEDLAIQYSDNEAARMSGGDLGWIDADRIQVPEIAEALALLEVGKVSHVVPTVDGLHLFKLEEKQATVVRPYAEVADAIRGKLVMERSEAAFGEVQHAVEEALALGASLKEIAVKYGLEVEQTGLMEEEQAMERLGLADESRAMLRDAAAVMAAPVQANAAVQTDAATQANATAQADAAAQANATAQADAPAALQGAASFATLVPVPLNIKGGIAVVEIAQVRPSLVPPLEEVRGEILSVLEYQDALLMAQSAATEALASFKGTEVPASYAARVKESPFFTRLTPMVPGLENSFSLGHSLMTAADENWLPVTHPTGKGQVIARVSAVEQAPEEGWEQVKHEFEQRLLERKAFETLQAFIWGSLERADIQENLGLLEYIRPR